MRVLLARWKRKLLLVLHRRRSRRSCCAAALLSLCLLMIFGGPAACIAHCFLSERLLHSHQHGHQHAVAGSLPILWNDPCLQGYSNAPISEQAPPSPLTIAIILTPLLLPPLLSYALLPLKLRQRLRSFVQPPPEEPPRRGSMPPLSLYQLCGKVGEQGAA
jgi:hypothetical protein